MQSYKPRAMRRHVQLFRRELEGQLQRKLEWILGGQARVNRDVDAALLRRRIAEASSEEIVAKAAIAWFIRLCMLRYMDVRGYSFVRTVSIAQAGDSPDLCHLHQPELSQQRIFQYEEHLEQHRQNVPDPTDNQNETFAASLLAVCDHFSERLPTAFPPLDGAARILVPELYENDRYLLNMLAALLPDDVHCPVENVGWLYQQYTAQEHDQVIRSKRTIGIEDLPAATQLFTPTWIVHYLVDNSLGRLLSTSADVSDEITSSDYFVTTDFVHTRDYSSLALDQVSVCDPAVGSGHMLTYAFDALYEAYASAGYASDAIARLILERNLYGIDIDERVAAIASFALLMKARERSATILADGIQPNICVLHPIDQVEYFYETMDALDLPEELRRRLCNDLSHLEVARSVGALIQPTLTFQEINDIGISISRADAEQSATSTQLRALQNSLRQLAFLARRYDVVVTNPPYMGRRFHNDELRQYLRKHYRSSKADLFAAFMLRCRELAHEDGLVGMMTPNVWMYLSSYRTLRRRLLATSTLITLLELPLAGYTDATVQICAFVFAYRVCDSSTAFIRLVDQRGGEEALAEQARLAIRCKSAPFYHVAHSRKLLNAPSSSLAYWIDERVLEIFHESARLGDIGNVCQGIATADNRRFLRLWHELSISDIAFGCTGRKEALATGKRWFPYNKGGAFRRWYGNQTHVIDWQEDGAELFAHRPRSVVRNPDTYFRPSLSWSKVTSGRFSLRVFPAGFIYDVAGCSIFVEDENVRTVLLSAMNSPVMQATVEALSPTLNYEVGQISGFPLPPDILSAARNVKELVVQLVAIAEEDLVFG